MRNKLAVIHYLPLEFYPPVTNFLEVVSKDDSVNAKVFTTLNNKGRKVYTNKKIDKTNRFKGINANDAGPIRLLKYVLFNVFTFLKLCLYRPNVVLYYETYSAMPVYWYKKYVNKNVRLLIHSHEYFSKSWYATGMKLLKIYHQKEVDYLYKKAFKITQTNNDRVQLFLNDYPFLSKDKMDVLPNYPPSSWIKERALNNQPKIVKSVYVGSLSLKSSYVKEYCDWVVQMNGQVFFDVYGYNIEKETDLYLKELNCEYINYYPKGLEYNEIPNVLHQYDTGVILYKALSYNVKYCEPNKLFEYMSAGLEVWYSNKMIGIKPFDKSTYPRVLAVDIESVTNNKELLGIKTEFKKHTPFTAESIYIPYLKNIRS